MAKYEVTRVRASFRRRRGMKLALDMLSDLEERDGEGNMLADACQLESDYSGDMPFRNIVHERLEAARKLGPDVEEGFCAVLSHVVSINALGFSGSAASVESVIRTEVANG